MTRYARNTPPRRRGAIAVLAAVLMILFVAMVAFSVDLGFIQAREAELQRTADSAVLAAVQDLIPAPDGTQDLDAVKATLRDYVRSNLRESGFATAEADIEIGRFDPSSIYTQVTLLNSGVFDAVRVTLRRDGVTNEMIPLFFARMLGVNSARVSATATAVLQKPAGISPGVGVLPFAVPADEWDDLDKGDSWTIYGDGKITDDSGRSVPGNWGTLDIGAENNSTSDLSDQIENGLHQSHLDALYNDGRISTNTHIDATEMVWMQADTGLSSGMRAAVETTHGQTRVIPLFDTFTGKSGNNLEYRIVGWGVVEVVDSNFKGSKNTYVKVMKSYMYNGFLTPNNNLSDPSALEGAFTTPVLVE